MPPDPLFPDNAWSHLAGEPVKGAVANDWRAIFFSTNKPPSLLFDLRITQVVIFYNRFTVCVCLFFCLEKVSGGFLGENFCCGPSAMSGLQQLL